MDFCQDQSSRPTTRGGRTGKTRCQTTPSKPNLGQQAHRACAGQSGIQGERFDRPVLPVQAMCRDIVTRMLKRSDEYMRRRTCLVARPRTPRSCFGIISKIGGIRLAIGCRSLPFTKEVLQQLKSLKETECAADVARISCLQWCRSDSSLLFQCALEVQSELPPGLETWRLAVPAQASS